MATELVWQHDYNRVNAGFGVAKNVDTYQMWYVYSLLTGRIGGATQGLWTLVGSSDGSTAGMDATERLGATFDPTRWVRATAEGSAHSWYVLKAPFKDGALDVHLILSYIGTADNRCEWSFVSGTLTTGTTTTTPTGEHKWGGSHLTTSTSTVSRQLTDASGASVGWKLHGSLATTGEFHIHASKNDTARFSWTLLMHRVVDRLDNETYDPVNGRDKVPWGFVGYTNPASGTIKHLITSVPSSGSYSISNTVCIGTLSTYAASPDQGARMPDRDHTETMAGIASFGLQGLSSTNYAVTFVHPVGNATGDRNKLPGGEWVTTPCYMFSGDSSASNVNARFDGRCPDLFQVSQSLVDGDVFPATGPIEYVVVGGLMMPGNAEPSL